jgi:hypothetical protein
MAAQGRLLTELLMLVVVVAVKKAAQRLTLAQVELAAAGAELLVIIARHP